MIPSCSSCDVIVSINPDTGETDQKDRRTTKHSRMRKGGLMGFYVQVLSKMMLKISMLCCISFRICCNGIKHNDPLQSSCNRSSPLYQTVAPSWQALGAINWQNHVNHTKEKSTAKA